MTLCNHAAQSITRQTVSLSLSLLRAQFFNRPSPVVPNSSRIGQRQRGPRSNLNLLWQKYIYIFRNIRHDLIHQMKTDFGQVLSRFPIVCRATFRPSRRGAIALSRDRSRFVHLDASDPGFREDRLKCWRIVLTRCRSTNRNWSNSISLACFQRRVDAFKRDCRVGGVFRWILGKMKMAQKFVSPLEFLSLSLRDFVRFFFYSCCLFFFSGLAIHGKGIRIPRNYNFHWSRRNDFISRILWILMSISHFEFQGNLKYELERI